MEYSRGNKKIGWDTAIINFTSALECPSKRMGLCRVCNICYARKAEKQYPAVLPYRRRQARQWRTQGIDRIARELPAVKYVRFSEAGDFPGQADVEKLGDLARARPDVVFYGYTARRDLDYSGLPANVVVNGSAFAVHNTFTAVAVHTPGSIRCPGNCRRCNLCKARRGIVIEVLNH